MRIAKLMILCVAAFFTTAIAKTYYVAVTGSDTNPGTIDLPFLTVPKAISSVAAGDTIYVRGGLYPIASTINISKSGTGTAPYRLYAYPGERPLLDFSSTALGSRGISLSGKYWHVKGFDIKGAGDNGMILSGSNNIVEWCSFSENRDTGLQISSGGSNNQVINCDSYFNSDPGQGNADGFAPKLDVGTGNYFYGCRSWQNSDDGWDGYMRGANDVSTTLENCWVFANGYLKDGSPSVGNGNGFKMGGGDSGNVSNWAHNMMLKNCVAFMNRVKGFDQNNNAGSMTLINCSGYGNGTNYNITRTLSPGKVLTLTNDVALGNYGSLGAFAVQQTNSWMSPFVVTTGDFISIDTSGVRGARKADGSLPDISFLHLAQGSDLINAGVDVGLPYKGSAPDLGAFESDYPAGVSDWEEVITDFRLDQNYPNPFNPSTKIDFSVGQSGHVIVRVFNVLGSEVARPFDSRAEAGKRYRLSFDGARLSAGIYFCSLESSDAIVVRKMSLVK
ncbi:MAG: right-handed parallel beta-helix repeat-containing protein [Bacteroidota bacterium]